VEHERDVEQGVVEVVLMAEEAVFADVLAVVATDDEEGVFPLAAFLECRSKLPDLLVDVGEFRPIQAAEEGELVVGDVVVPQS